LGFVDGSVPYSQLMDRSPYIAGSFTGWRYKRMMPIHEFTMMLAKSEVGDPVLIAK
jgi:hypothetical protein